MGADSDENSSAHGIAIEVVPGAWRPPAQRGAVLEVKAVNHRQAAVSIAPPDCETGLRGRLRSSRCSWVPERRFPRHRLRSSRAASRSGSGGRGWRRPLQPRDGCCSGWPADITDRGGNFGLQPESLRQCFGSIGGRSTIAATSTNSEASAAGRCKASAAIPAPMIARRKRSLPFMVSRPVQIVPLRPRGTPTIRTREHNAGGGRGKRTVISEAELRTPISYDESAHFDE